MWISLSCGGSTRKYRPQLCPTGEGRGKKGEKRGGRTGGKIAVGGWKWKGKLEKEKIATNLY
jgi:hypothetical protein